MAIRCPNCRAENPEGKKFCGDCGVILTPLQAREYPLRPTVMPRKTLRGIALAIITLAVVLAVVLAVLLVSLSVSEPPSPTGTLEEWVVQMNSGDARGAADLTIYSQMDVASYNHELEILAVQIAHMGTDKMVILFEREIPEAEVALHSWYSSMLELIVTLEYNYGKTVENYAGVTCSVLNWYDGRSYVVTNEWPALKIDDTWYLAYRTL